MDKNKTVTETYTEDDFKFNFGISFLHAEMEGEVRDNNVVANASAKDKKDYEKFNGMDVIEQYIDKLGEIARMKVTGEISLEQAFELKKELEAKCNDKEPSAAEKKESKIHGSFPAFGYNVQDKSEAIVNIFANDFLNTNSRPDGAAKFLESVHLAPQDTQRFIAWTKFCNSGTMGGEKREAVIASMVDTFAQMGWSTVPGITISPAAKQQQAETNVANT